MKKVLGILRFPYMLVIGNTANAVSDIRDGSGENKLIDKITNAASMIPVLGAVVILLYSLITFIADSGFGRQIALIKAEGFKALNDIWDNCNSDNFYSLWICIVLGSVLAVTAGIAAVKYYKSEAAKWKKSVFTILVAVIDILTAVLSFAAIDFADFKGMLESFGITGNDPAMKFCMILLGIAVLNAVICTVFLAGYSPFIRCFINAVFFFTIAPLTCLCIGNIIALVFMVICIAVMWIAGSVGLTALTSSSPSGSSASSASSNKDAARAAKERQKIKDRIAAKERGINERQHCVEEHSKMTLGYWGIDPKSCARKNAKEAEEIARLKAELEAI